MKRDADRRPRRAEPRHGGGARRRLLPARRRAHRPRAARWPPWPPTRRSSSATSGSDPCAAPCPRSPASRSLLLPLALDRAAHLRDAHGGGPRDGHAHLPGRLRPHAHLRAHGRAQLRPRRPVLLGRLRRLQRGRVLLDRRLGWASAPSPIASLGLLVAAVLAAALVAAALGVLLERVVVRPVYGQHLFQILITLGATIVLEELIRIAWGPNDQVVPLPVALQGSWDLADVIVLRFPVAAIGLGLLVYAGLQLVLTRTRVGLIVRAGVENGEMVQAMGHDLRRYFTAVFAAGSALAGVGGAHVGLLRPVGAPRDGGRAADLRVHRRHHRRARQRHRLPGRRPPGGPLVQLRGLPGPEGRPRREHGAHGAGPAAAADRPVRRAPDEPGPR